MTTIRIGERVSFKSDGYEVHGRIVRIRKAEGRVLVESESGELREWVDVNTLYFQRGEFVVDADGNVAHITMVDTDGDLRLKSAEGSSFVYRTHVSKAKA